FVCPARQDEEDAADEVVNRCAPSPAAKIDQLFEIGNRIFDPENGGAAKRISSLRELAVFAGCPTVAVLLAAPCRPPTRGLCRPSMAAMPLQMLGICSGRPLASIPICSTKKKGAYGA